MDARSRAATLALVVLVACAGDGPSSSPPGPTTSTVVSGVPTTDVTPSPTVATVPGRILPPAGSVRFSVFNVPVATSGLRVLMGPVGTTLSIVVRGAPTASNTVELCPVEDSSTSSPAAGECVALPGGGPVELDIDGFAGVLVRPVEGSARPPERLGEVAFTYRPSGASLTVVTPPLPPSPQPGECSTPTCQMSFQLTPTGPGTFALDADGRGGRPQFLLEAGPPVGGPSRVRASVDGGSQLTIRATIAEGADAFLTYRNLGPATLPPLEVELSWPLRA